MDLEEDIPTQKTEAKSGQKIGGCILERKLGEGGMGSVWEAHQISLDRKVAVKILSPELSSDREFVERFKREARLVGRLQSPYIVQVYDTGAEEGIGYIVMERLQGMSLQDRIDDSGPLNESESLRILSEVSRGLAVAHAQGLVHRDIKPANIFLCSDGTTKILDFGIAHDRLSDITRTGEILGTPNYMSPEHGCGKEVTEKSDLYALGSTIYAALTGTPPFRGGTPVAVLRMHIDEPPVPLRGIQPGLNELILSLMEKRASERPANADKVAEIAEKLRDGKPPIRWPRIPNQLVWGILGATLLASAGIFRARFRLLSLVSASIAHRRVLRNLLNWDSSLILPSSFEMSKTICTLSAPMPGRCRKNPVSVRVKASASSLPILVTDKTFLP